MYEGGNTMKNYSYVMNILAFLSISSIYVMSLFAFWIIYLTKVEVPIASRVIFMVISVLAFYEVLKVYVYTRLVLLKSEQ